MAQFFGLATSDDGSRLYFATALRQKNTMQPDYGKLFRIDASGLSLQESRTYQAPPSASSGIPGFGHYDLSNAYDLQYADVSSDGQVIAAAARRDCIGDLSLCAKRGLFFVTTISSSGGSHDYPDELHLSANGKWAFGGTGIPFASSVYGYLVNVTTGEQTELGPGTLVANRFRVASSGRPIANDGTAVFSEDAAVVVLQGSRTSRIPTQNYDEPVDAVIDAGAHTIVYSVIAAIVVGPGGVCICGGQSLHRANAVTGESTLLVPDGYAPSIRDDGQTVLYLSSRSGTPQAWLINTDGSGDRELSYDPLGVTRAILSGDGSTAYAVTLGGQLLKITITTGETEELIPRTPNIDANQETAPGKLVTFTGEGLSDVALSAAPPLPYTLDSISVTIQGEPTRILGVQPTSLTVLTPPGAMPTVYPNLTAPLQLDVASPSPFAGPIVPVQIVSYFPEFVWQSSRHMLAAREDWSAVVTADNPARPGEVVHAYAVGLGATSPAIPYGAPAPAQEPLARLIDGYHCSSFSDTTKEVQVLFQGLAPTFAGIYQFDWRIPLNLPAGDFGLFCQTTNGGPNFGGFIPVRP